MANIYKGNTPELYKLFISGKQLQFQKTFFAKWEDMPVYNGEADDIYRVSNTNYFFRVKDVVKMYMHYDLIEAAVQNNNFDCNSPDNIMYNSNRAMSEHLEFTFTNGKLTSVELKGPTTQN